MPALQPCSFLIVPTFAMRTWPEFCVLKLLGDLAEILQVEDLIQCSFHPLRNLARMTMPEERFHAQFGVDFCGDLCQTEDGRRAVQDAIDRIFPSLPAFFGRAKSKNNEIFRKWGIKERTNEAMRADYIERAAIGLLRPGQNFEEILPVGLVGSMERAIASYLPLAAQRLGGLLDDPETRRKFQSTIEELLQRLLRDLKFHQRVVARVVMTEDTIQRYAGLVGIQPKRKKRRKKKRRKKNS